MYCGRVCVWGGVDGVGWSGCAWLIGGCWRGVHHPPPPTIHQQPNQPPVTTPPTTGQCGWWVVGWLVGYGRWVEWCPTNRHHPPPTTQHHPPHTLPRHLTHLKPLEHLKHVKNLTAIISDYSYIMLICLRLTCIVTCSNVSVCMWLVFYV